MQRRCLAGSPSFLRLITLICLFLLIFVVYLRLFAPDSLSIPNRWSDAIVYDSNEDPSEAENLQLSKIESENDIPLDGRLLPLAHSVINTVFNRPNGTLSRLECPRLNQQRYEQLQQTNLAENTSKIDFLFAIDLYQSVHILPSLLGSVLDAMGFLGTHRCALSIVEGRSTDGTLEVLQLLRQEMKALGVEYHFLRSDKDPLAEGVNRIASLAELRNAALLPMTSNPTAFSSGATIVFLNDISLCTEDILELVYQKRRQGADMVCGMDWTSVGPTPTFYDVWVARGMNGDSFFHIPKDGNWDSAWNLFWNDESVQQALAVSKPFQVFSCWNGVAVFTAEPILTNKVKFRHSYEGECYQGEPQLLCKDFWYLGYRKIAVIPSVNVEYSDEASRKIKATKGFVSSSIMTSDMLLDKNIDKVIWRDSPPEKVKCIYSWDNQVWVPWDEYLLQNI